MSYPRARGSCYPSAAMDKEQRRAQILDVARAVFAEKGYHDAKIDDIVARARIARGTFYLYFEDKRTIFEELVAGFVARLGEVITTIDITPGAPSPVAQLADNVRRVVELCLVDAAMTKILLSDAVGLDAAFDRRLLAFYDEVTTVIERSLLAGEAIGVVRPGNAHLRALCLVGLLKELLYQVVVRRVTIATDQIVETVMDLVLDGVLTDSSRHPPGAPAAAPA